MAIAQAAEQPSHNHRDQEPTHDFQIDRCFVRVASLSPAILTKSQQLSIQLPISHCEDTFQISLYCQPVPLVALKHLPCNCCTSRPSYQQSSTANSQSSPSQTEVQQNEGKTSSFLLQCLVISYLTWSYSIQSSYLPHPTNPSMPATCLYSIPI